MCYRSRPTNLRIALISKENRRTLSEAYCQSMSILCEDPGWPFGHGLPENWTNLFRDDHTLPSPTFHWSDISEGRDTWSVTGLGLGPGHSGLKGVMFYKNQNTRWCNCHCDRCLFIHTHVLIKFCATSLITNHYRFKQSELNGVYG